MPVAAVGLLQHSQRILGEDGLFSEDRVSRVLPNHLSVLHRVACEQPGLIPQVSGWVWWRGGLRALALVSVCSADTQAVAACRCWPC